MTATSLAILPSLPAIVGEDGRLTITEKFVDGMGKYLEYWGGPATVFMEPVQQRSTNLDEKTYAPEDLPFAVKLVDFLDPKLPAMLVGHRAALGTVSYRQNHLAEASKSLGVPFLYVTEYSLKTRYQVVRADTTNPLLRLRRDYWQWNQERKHRKAIAAAAGVQCNGTPTFEAYRDINPRPLLYFDTRVTEELLATGADVDRRTAAMLQGEPLRLIFSGRFVAMKGADDLPKVAAELKRLGVPFTMQLFGGGPLEAKIREEIARLGLGDCVTLGGVLDFKAELMPRTTREADLFVCCHRSGDPSCTYLEVMSCGVPIVGYDNEAFRGIVDQSDVGWIAPMNHPEKLAAQIASLHANRQQLANAARKALEFGRLHTFDRTFRARIEHIRACSQPHA